MRRTPLLPDSKNSGLFVYGVDPGLVNVGVVLIPREDIGLHLPVPKILLFRHFHPENDLATRFRSLRFFFEHLFSCWPPVMVFVEDVDMRPFIQRRAQSQLWASVSLILSTIPTSSGYYMVDKTKAKKVLGMMVKRSSDGRTVPMSKEQSHKWLSNHLPEEFFTIKKTEREHILDAVLVLWAGLRLTSGQ